VVKKMPREAIATLRSQLATGSTRADQYLVAAEEQRTRVVRREREFATDKAAHPARMRRGAFSAIP